jgi:carrier-protein-independent halogenase WelO5-like protein
LFGAAGLEAKIESMLAALAGDRTVRLALGPDGVSRYVPSTAKVIAQHGYIPPHCELEQLARPPYRHLRDVIDATTLVSFFFMLRPADAGGALRIHALTWDAIDKSRMRDQRTYEAVMPVLDRYPHEDVHPGAGDLVVFDGGRFVHEVTRVEGAMSRLTVGGFLARSRDGAQALYWG